MSLLPIPYRTLESILQENLFTDEDYDALNVIRFLKPAKKRGCLTKSELEVLCRWKSPRAIRHIKSNTENRVQKLTSDAFSTRSEMRKMEYLTQLKGVSIPMASAILTMTNPQRYGIIDIRVWQLLYKMGSVHKNEKGINFTINQWYQYLMIIRHFSKKFDVKARDVERTLFLVHKEWQEGNLYGKSI
jgi:thermostable 8-oxoguanine DNA glycosylase